MELILKRIARKPTYTIGQLFIANADGKPQTYICDTLEPAWRDYAHGEMKIPGLSAIPEGEYTVVITWSPKFREWLPQIIGDQDFNRQWQGVRIHAGNTPPTPGAASSRARTKSPAASSTRGDASA